MLYVLTFKNIDKIIPTSPQWKGLVLPVVQLYTMMFLGLKRKRWKQKNIREAKSILSLMYHQSRKTWWHWLPLLYYTKSTSKRLFLKCLGFSYKYYYYHKRMLRDYMPWLTHKKDLLWISTQVYVILVWFKWSFRTHPLAPNKLVNSVNTLFINTDGSTCYCLHCTALRKDHGISYILIGHFTNMAQSGLRN